MLLWKNDPLIIELLECRDESAVVPPSLTEERGEGRVWVDSGEDWLFVVMFIILLQILSYHMNYKQLYTKVKI